MALTRPILNQVPAWDKTKGYNFTFNVIGGDQVVGSVLTIVNQTTGSVVYTHAQTSYAFVNEVPANASGLVNGGYYTATLVTKNASGTQSVPSAPIQFYCYSTPTVTIDGFEQTPTIESSEYAFTGTYTQTQAEMLNTYRWILYDASGKEVANSGIKYATNLTPSYYGDSVIFNLSQVFSSLENNNSYFIELICETVNNTRVTTGRLQFNVDYRTSSAYAQIIATNNCDKGYITVESNAIALTGRAVPAARYTAGNTEIDLRRYSGNDYYVVFDQGYQIPNDFTAKMWFDHLGVFTELKGLVLSFQNGAIKVDILRSKTNGYVYCRVVVDNSYVIYSNDVGYASALKYCLQLRKVNNIYEVSLEEV